MVSFLKGKQILVTREQSQAEAFSKEIEKRGAVSIEAPVLKISCTIDVENQKIISDLSPYKWLFFTSANGVDCFFNYLDHLKVDKQLMVNCKIATVGSKTEEALIKYGFTADFIPSTYNAEVMAKEFLEQYINVSPVLLVRGNRSRSVLPKAFEAEKIIFDSLEVYETNYNAEIKDRLSGHIGRSDLDFITFASPSAVDAFTNLIDLDEIKETTKVVCIGTTTENRALELGFTNMITAKKFTVEGMLTAMEAFLHTKG